MTTLGTVAEKYYEEARMNGTPWPSGGVEEREISTNGYSSYCYARDVVKGPWKLGEPMISQDALWSKKYARDVIKGRWEMGEEALSSKACWYWSTNYLEVLGLGWDL